MEITASCSRQLSFSLLIYLFCFSMLHTPISATKKSYVVYLGEHSHGSNPSSADLDRATDSHHEFLGSFLGSHEKAKDSMFYSYNKYINGFAAELEEEEAEEISKHPDVISVFLSKGKKLHTTRSWEFLGLEKDGKIQNESLWRKGRFGEDVIIGHLDSGVWPESDSFLDDGVGPVPAKWKGFCQNSTSVDGVSCNRKLIGARYFNQGYEPYRENPDIEYHTARDTNWHGTHTLSTSGGRFLDDVSWNGQPIGVVKGGAPSARLAMYKVCWPKVDENTECPDADILAAFDAAIHDGVDVLSVSLGGQFDNYLEDSVAIGSFHAVKNGITVVCSGGNEGLNGHGTVENVAPWLITVGATTINREIVSYVELGNKMRLRGQSLSGNSLPAGKLYPLITGAAAKASDSFLNSNVCAGGSLDPKKVKGKIVVCIRGRYSGFLQGQAVLDAGGIGMIIIDDRPNDVIPEALDLPASHISTVEDGLIILSYINSTKYPMAYITPATTQLGVKPAPRMALFSSQGPNNRTAEILKPDIVAPGVSIIASIGETNILTNTTWHKHGSYFQAMSGTSMACPHVSGVVALLKSLYPRWSPAAIRSAIMTTARSRDNEQKPIRRYENARATPFATGAGLVRPNRAMDPGLVYDTTISDYSNFLCAVGYDNSQLAKFVDKDFSCSKSFSLLDLNYPAIVVPRLQGEVTVTRTLKNVGLPGKYTVKVTEPFRFSVNNETSAVSVKVQPKKLNFKKTDEEKTFTVTLKVKRGHVIEDHVFGRLVWSDGVHYVRSPIVVMEGK